MIPDVRSMLIGLSTLGAITASTAASAQPVDVDAVQVARLVSPDLPDAPCFSTGFLDLLRFETSIDITPQIVDVPIDSDLVYDHPFAIMTGEGAFHLSDADVESLRDYLARGGFLIASAGCSNEAWSVSMRRTIQRVFPDLDLAPIGDDHPIFSMVFDIASLTTTRGREARLEGVSLDGRLAIVFSQQGLNDTAAAGGGCCCCGGEEVRQARFLNANLVVYALTR